MQDILNLKRNLNPIIGSKVTAIFQLSVKFHPNGSANGGATPSRNRSDFSLCVTVRVKSFDSPAHLMSIYFVFPSMDKGVELVGGGSVINGA